MARGTKHSPEQIVNVLRQTEVAIANGKSTPLAGREAGILNRPTTAGARHSPLEMLLIFQLPPWSFVTAHRKPAVAASSRILAGK